MKIWALVFVLLLGGCSRSNNQDAVDQDNLTAAEAFASCEDNCHSIANDSPIAPLSGSHQRHLEEYGCEVCHADILSDPNHVDGEFDSTNSIAFNDSNPDATYNSTDMSCHNSYCHGFIGGSQGGTPNWGDSLSCGDCHGKIPSTASHSAHAKNISDCSICHDGAGDGTKFHGDGFVEISFGDLAGSEAQWEGRDKKCATTYCHGDGEPVWGGNVACGSCHTVPPISASHSAHGLLASSCETCHLGGGKGGAKHADGIVTLAFHEIAGTEATYQKTTQTCASTYCHAPSDPIWGGSAPCGSCHEEPGVLATNRHLAHFGPYHANGDCAGIPGCTPTAADASQCSSCHMDAGSGTESHADGIANVKFDSRNPLASYDPIQKGCSGVGMDGDGNVQAPFCHSNSAGGPLWVYGPGILPSEQCTEACHH